MNCYDIQVGGRVVWNRTEEDVVLMFNLGAIDRSTPCRRSGAEQWAELNEYFPLLKYPGVEVREPRSGVPPRSRSAALPSTRPGRTAVGALALLFCGALLGAAATAFYHHANAPVTTVLESSAPLPLATIAKPPPEPARSQVTTQRASISAASNGNYRSPERRRVASKSQSYPVRSAPRPAPAAAPRPAREYKIPLNQATTVSTDYGALVVKILDHGPVTFTVWINYGHGRRIEKIKGFETTGTNITPIYAFSGARVYYVDRISVSPGYCVLKVIPN